MSKTTHVRSTRTIPVFAETIDQLFQSLTNLRATLLCITSDDVDAFFCLDERTQRDLLFMVTEEACDAYQAITTTLRGDDHE